MIKLKTTFLAAALAASFSAFAPSLASAQNFTVRIAPPETRQQLEPGPRRGYVWVPGYWNWNAQRARHVWVGPTWVRERHGYYYNQPQWVERDGRWGLQRGNWARGQRDRDGDGVRNRDDRNPNNPRRQ